jgi:hypothetical protein
LFASARNSMARLDGLDGAAFLAMDLERLGARELGAARGITSRARPPAAGDCPRWEGGASPRSRPPPFPGTQPRW